MTGYAEVIPAKLDRTIISGLPTIRELECAGRHYGVFRGQTFADVIKGNQQRRFGYFRFAKKSSAAI
jgi:hypothetical protein